MQKVLVTGAAGFVGGWTVDCFQLSGIPVRAGIRQWNSAVRLARRPTEIVACDVLSPEQLHQALSGCDAVVHCAVGDDQVTVEGTRNVLAAAHECGTRRIVHLSTVATYGRSTGMISEKHTRRSEGDAYARRKIEAEQVCEEFIDRGAPVVILRPTIIYGPFSQTWTVSFANRLISGKWGHFGPVGEGTCNLVYVTDVVQAIYRALISENALGEVFNINGGELITWNEYFEGFNAALGRDPLPQLKTWPIKLKASLLAPVRAAGRFALTKCGGALARVHAKSSLAAKFLRATESSLRLTPTSQQLDLYSLDAEYVIDKARKGLGYEPRVDPSLGHELCVAWLHRQGILH